MVTKTVAPYGTWESVISIDDATAGSKSLSSPRGDVRTGRAFYLESQPSGASTIVEVLPPGDDGATKLRRVLPEPHSVSTSVYEYGGGPYEVLPAQEGGHPDPHQRILFSDGKDGNAIKVLDVDAGEVAVLQGGKPWLRYSDFGVGPVAAGESWVLAVEEDHSHPAPEDVKNYVVGVHLRTGAVTRLVAGADFYTNPRFSRDGKRVAWRQWDHPEMPWTKSELHWAPVVLAPSSGGGGGGDDDDDGVRMLAVGESSRVAGGKRREPVGEALWGPDGALYFTHEVEEHDWRQLFRAWPGERDAKAEKVHLKGLEEVEIGNCSMIMDSRTFGFLSDTSMVLSYTKYAINSYVHVDLNTLKVTHLDVPLIDARFDPISPINATSFLVAGSGSTLQQGMYRVTLDADLHATTALLDSASNKSYPPGTFSQAEHIQLVSKKDPRRPIHGFYFPPHNDKFTAPEGTLPPLLINPHGGPTGHSGAGLKIGGVGGGNAAFWTSRGYGYFVINYTGSSGHGRAYRQRLYGQWGVLDRDDVPECVDYLCGGGDAGATGATGPDPGPRADRARVGIHGASAGGYNVLQSLVGYPGVFAAGVSYCGVSDVAALGAGTHKLESHYNDGLLYDNRGGGMSEEEKRAVARARSPLFHAGRVRAPLLLLHGDEDTVVPVRQSCEIEARVRGAGAGVPVKMVVAPGEGHMFRMRRSQVLALENEVDWLTRYLVHK